LRKNCLLKHVIAVNVPDTERGRGRLRAALRIKGHILEAKEGSTRSVSGELALEEAMDLSQDGLFNDDEFGTTLIRSFFTTAWHIITDNGADSL
jgi:hypothetical protein